MTLSSSRLATALLMLGLTALLATSPSRAAAVDASAATKADVVRNAIEDYLRPAYDDVAVAAQAMTDGQGDLCAVPGRDRLREARTDFASLVQAFSRIEYVRFGPIMDDNRVERILFWPDRRGVALRQIQAILAAKDETAATVAGLHAKSVAVQGLNALEFVLFGTGADDLEKPEGAFRCRYGVAIAGNLGAIARDLSAGWQAEDGIAHAMMHPGPSDPSFRTTDDALQQIVGVFIHGFEAMRDLKLKPAFGETIDKANPKAWIYQRSELTDASLHAGFAGLSELYDTSRIGDLLPEPDRWAKASIKFEFGNAGRTFQTIGLPLAIAAADPDKRGGVGYLIILTQSLQDLFAVQVAPALGLSAGFSALDGD